MIDDGSTDGTQDILGRREWTDRVRLVSHAATMGKGAAVRTGIREARGEVTAIFDADLEYDPADLALVVDPVLAGESNAVVRGARLRGAHAATRFLYVIGQPRRRRSPPTCSSTSTSATS